MQIKKYAQNYSAQILEELALNNLNIDFTQRVSNNNGSTFKSVEWIQQIKSYEFSFITNKSHNIWYREYFICL